MIRDTLSCVAVVDGDFHTSSTAECSRRSGIAPTLAFVGGTGGGLFGCSYRYAAGRVTL